MNPNHPSLPHIPIASAISPNINDTNSNITKTESDNDSSYSSENNLSISHISISHNTNCNTFHQGRWTDKEHKLFLEGLVLYYNDWKLVQKHIGTRSSTQSRSHAQKFFISVKNKLCHLENEGELKEHIYQSFVRCLGNKKLISNKKVFCERMYRLVFSMKDIMNIKSGRNAQRKKNNVKGEKRLCDVMGMNCKKVNKCKMKKYDEELQWNNKEIFRIHKDKEGNQKGKENGVSQCNNNGDNSNVNSSTWCTHSKHSSNNIHKIKVSNYTPYNDYDDQYVFHKEKNEVLHGNKLQLYEDDIDSFFFHNNNNMHMHNNNNSEFDVINPIIFVNDNQHYDDDGFSHHRRDLDYLNKLHDFWD
jgi:SHAQKYF class myb-like DNA-binding protein